MKCTNKIRYYESTVEIMTNQISIAEQRIHKLLTNLSKFGISEESLEKCIRNGKLEFNECNVKSFLDIQRTKTRIEPPQKSKVKSKSVYVSPKLTPAEMERYIDKNIQIIISNSEKIKKEEKKDNLLAIPKQNDENHINFRKIEDQDNEGIESIERPSYEEKLRKLSYSVMKNISKYY